MKKPFIFIILLTLCQCMYSQELASLQNKYIQISVKKTGAELCGIKLLSNGKDYMWDANPKIWGGSSPVLFPIVGVLKNNGYYVDNKKYQMSGHGFFQRNPKVELVSITKNSLTYKLKYDEESLKIYPFQFEFFITYTLKKNQIIVSHLVKNLGEGDMYFSLGGHPAFKCPIDSGEKHTDYYLEFEKPETAYTYQIERSGLLGGKTDLILNNSRIIKLQYDMFNKDALVFKDNKSTSVSLCSKISGKRVQVDYKGFPYLGFWAMPNADYVCIEPWMGINDSVGASQDFKNKEGIIKLKGKKSFKAAYKISIF